MAHADHNKQIGVDKSQECTESRAVAGEVGWIGWLAALPILLLIPPYMLEHPYWYDESWVVVASKAPISKLLLATSTTPIGWTVLMTLVPGPGDQRQRLLPLAFAVGTVVFAYLLARDLQWPTPANGRIAGILTALFVAIAPIALLRQDLKQYTADACLTLLAVWLVVRLETAWSTKRLWALVVVGVIGSLVSYVMMFVLAAAMTSLFVTAAVRGDRQRTIHTALAGAATAVGFAIVVLLFVLPHVNDRLVAFWERYYLNPSDGLWQIGTDVWQRFDKLAPLLGFKWPLLTIALVFIGSVAIARSGRWASSAILPILYLEMFVLGLAGRYPFLDQRTSHFLLLLTVAVAAIGVVYTVVRLHQQFGGRAVGPVLLVGIVVFGFYGASPYVGGHTIPNEDIRSQTEFVEENVQPGDMILVSAIGSYGFAYYWDRNDPVFIPSDAFSNGFGVDFEEDNIVIATARTTAAVVDALDEALVAASHPDASGRIWLIRSHVSKDEKTMWAAAFDGRDLSVEVIGTRWEPLSLISVPSDNDT